MFTDLNCMASAFILRLELKVLFDLVVVLNQRSIEEHYIIFDLSFAHTVSALNGHSEAVSGPFLSFSALKCPI